MAHASVMAWILSADAFRLDFSWFACSQMRQYLKIDEKWKNWENMDMQWISHHNPDLVVLDDNGKEKERIDLQGLTAAKLESMLEARGFKRR